MRLLTTILLSLSLSFISCGEKKDKEESTSDSNPEKESPEVKTKPETYVEGNKSLLWEITGNGIEKPSYLYGTMHIIDESLFFTGDNMTSKFEQVDNLVMEIKDISDLRNFSSIMDEMYLEEGTLADHVPEDLYEEFLTALEEKADISRDMFEAQYANMKPFFLYAVISGSDGMKNTKSYERYFMDLAFDHDLDLVGLETVHDQLSFFNTVSYEDMISYFVTMLSGNQADESELDQLGEIYATQDLDKIAELTLDSDDVLMTEYRDAFLDGRNRNWIPTIEELVAKGSCFIAVGAAHLPGDQGVINLLREQGYTVQAISVE